MGQHRAIRRFPPFERYAGILAAIGLLAAYVPPLTHSFWVDEAGTYWMARGGPVAALEKTWHWPGQSILFSVLSSLFCIDGFAGRELLLRVPALVGVGLLCYFLYRFGDDAIGPTAGKSAALIGAFHPLTILLGTEARPYSLAMAAVTASCWTLYRWVKSGENRWLRWWILASVLIVYLQYLFVIAFAAQLIYLAIKRRTVNWKLWTLALLATCALVGPLLPHLLLLFRESGTLPFTPKPDPYRFFFLVVNPLFAGIMALAGLIVRGAGGKLAVQSSPDYWVTLMWLVWWLAGPLLLYEVSAHSTMRMFVPRYLAYVVPAFALLLASAGYFRLGARQAIAWALIAGLLGVPLHILDAGRPGAEDLAPFMQMIRDENSNAKSPLAPVMFSSELPESNAYDWRAGNAVSSYLYAPFAAYPVPNRLVPLPNRITPDAEAYLRNVIPTDLSHQPVVLLIARNPAWVRLVAGEFEKQGFGYRCVQPNSFYVARFEKRSVAQAGGCHLQ